METKKSIFTEALGDSVRLQILEFFIEGRELDHAKQDVVDATGLSRSSIYLEWPSLERQKIIKLNRKVAKTKLYKLNMRNPVAFKLTEIFDALLRKQFKKVRT